MAAQPPNHPTGGDAAAALERASILADAADDPALASCCVRDLEAQARAERVKAKLASADRVEARVRAALAPAPLRNAPGDGDGDLASIRAARLAQMQAQAAAARSQAAASSSRGGTLDDLRGGKALWRLVDGAGGGGPAPVAPGLAPPVVAHLYVPGAPGGAALDEVLAGLAADQGGGGGAAAPRFVRVPAGARGVAAGAGLPGAGVPVLAAFRGGALVAKAPVAAFMTEGGGGGGEDGPDEDGVVAWLRAARVLPRKPPAGAAAAGASSSDEEGEDDDGEGADPCPECGRTYEHEHIRSTRAGGRGGGCGGDSSSSSEE